MFNHLSTLLKVEIGAQVDAWSIGCLVRLSKFSVVLSDWNY